MFTLNADAPVFAPSAQQPSGNAAVAKESSRGGGGKRSCKHAQQRRRRVQPYGCSWGEEEEVRAVVEAVVCVRVCGVQGARTRACTACLPHTGALVYQQQQRCTTTNVVVQLRGIHSTVWAP